MSGLVSYDLVSNAERGIPWCDWLWAGVPCVQKSKANNHRGSKSNQECIKAGSGPIGGGFVAVFRFAEKFRPPIISIENVPEVDSDHLGESDAAYIKTCFLQLG